MKRSLEAIMILSCLGCNSHQSIYTDLKIEYAFSKKGHYGFEKIYLRAGNKFTRYNELVPTAIE